MEDVGKVVHLDQQPGGVVVRHGFEATTTFLSPAIQHRRHAMALVAVPRP
jgi:hypothetical protein